MIVDFYRRHRQGIALAVSGSALALTLAYLVAPAAVAIIGIGAGWLAAMATIVINHPEKAEAIAGRLLGTFGWANSRAQRLALSAELQGTINGGRNELHDEVAGLMPYPARVKFVRSEGDIATLQEGEVVIALHDPRRHAENVARGTLAYVAAATIPPARAYVDRQVLRSIDFSLTKRILRASSGEALDFFLNQLWSPSLVSEPELRELCHEIEVIERDGLLTRVLLAEYLELGRRLYGQFPPADVHEATLALLHLLYRIVTRDHSEEIGDQLLFRNGPLRVGIVLVADRKLSDRLGPSPYVWRCLRDMKAGCDSVYLLARGSNRRLLGDVVASLRTNGRVLDIQVTEYDVPSHLGVVAVTCARIAFEQTSYRLPAPASMVEDVATRVS